MLRTLMLAVGLLAMMAAGDGGRAAAQAPPPAPPPGMTQQQFDALVDAIGAAVVRKLMEQGAIPAKPVPPAAGKTPASDADGDRFRAESLLLADRIETVSAAIPALFRFAGELAPQLDRRGSGGTGPDGFFLLLALAAALGLAAEIVTRLVLRRVDEAVMRGRGEAPGLWRLAGLALVDAVPILVLAVVARAAGGWWFAGEDAQARLATLVLYGLVAWRSYVLIFRLWFRPALPAARIVPVDRSDASRIYGTLSVVTLTMAAARSWSYFFFGSGATADMMAALSVLNNVFITIVDIAAILYTRDSVGRWFAAMVEHRHHAGDHIRVLLARRWYIFAIALALGMGAAHLYEVMFARLAVSQAVLTTLTCIVGLVLIETLLDYVTRRLSPPAATSVAGEAEPRFVDVAARCLRVLLRIIAALAVAEIWVVDVMMLVRQQDLWRVARSGVTAGATLFLAFVAWEIVKFLAQRYAVRYPALPPGAGPEDNTGSGAASNVSRLRTLLPVMRVAMAITIVVLTVLIVLSELGVNIAPLIAGASVVGLAISFGSQTLVRDIVSGIFYLADDAFRVGEYVDAGKAKGTVEGFTLRSLRLRHQNGQIHTIPFGQLGQITNFSRDWTTLKFNLRFARDTDIEKLRKTVKKIGLEMMEDPELKRDLLQPLKMQGVTDIADNALIVRFKFTCRPIKPTYIQRQAVKRMFEAFPAAGIEFAQATIHVHALGGQHHDPAMLGAAAAGVQAAPAATAAS